MKVVIKDTYEEASLEAFSIVEEIMKQEKPLVLGFATGSSPLGLYKLMIKDHHENGTSYKNVISFNLDEYVGLPKSHRESYYSFMHRNLFDHIDIDETNVHIPPGDTDDPEEAAVRYEEMMKHYTVDLQILGIGSDGHIAFNEPGTPFDSETHIVELTEQTRRDNARFFEDNIDLVPKRAITQGLKTIMRAKKIILIANGYHKAEAIARAVDGEKTTACTASILQDHPDVTFILDGAAALKLSDRNR